MILLNINSHAKESTKLVLQDLLSIKAPATVCLIEDSPCCLTGLRKPVTHTGLTRPTPGESLSLPLVWPGLLREKACHSHWFDPAFSGRKPVNHTEAISLSKFYKLPFFEAGQPAVYQTPFLWKTNTVCGW